MTTVAGTAISLLLVEENDWTRESLGVWISMTFPEVRLIAAQDHSAGISLSASESPDVVVMDISGLGRGGAERVRGMKTAYPSALILALVTLDHRLYRQAALEAGAESCVYLWNIRGELLPQLEDRLRASRCSFTRQSKKGQPLSHL